MLDEFTRAQMNIIHSYMKKHDEKALAEGRIVQVGDLKFGCTRKQFAETVFELGFNGVTLYWPDDGTPDTKIDKPYVRPRFPDKAKADRAKTALHKAKFHGRAMNVGEARPRNQSRPQPASAASPAVVETTPVRSCQRAL